MADPEAEAKAKDVSALVAEAMATRVHILFQRRWGNLTAPIFISS